jgi:hypothetical protein
MLPMQYRLLRAFNQSLTWPGSTSGRAIGGSERTSTDANEIKRCLVLLTRVAVHVAGNFQLLAVGIIQEDKRSIHIIIS